jgi:hypothetical protein
MLLSLCTVPLLNEKKSLINGTIAAIINIEALISTTYTTLMEWSFDIQFLPKQNTGNMVPEEIIITGNFKSINIQAGTLKLHRMIM